MINDSIPVGRVCVFQLVGCVYLQDLAKSYCWLIQLLSIVCLNSGHYVQDIPPGETGDNRHLSPRALYKLTTMCLHCVGFMCRFHFTIGEIPAVRNFSACMSHKLSVLLEVKN